MEKVTSYRSAADTGSATHAAIAAFHMNGRDAEVALEAMRAGVNAYPFADFDAASGYFQHYAKDPRNQETLVAIEQEIHWEEGGVWFKGTTDQIRREGEALEVWDIKTSQGKGEELVETHMYQLVGYARGASILLGEPCSIGGIIRVRDYPKGKVFHHLGWGPKTVAALFEGVVQRVKYIRRGTVFPQPGPHCRWCPAGSIETCVPKFQEFSCRTN